MRANTHVLEPRRTPRQIRSQRRVEKILEAAASVMNEVGFEAATTNAISERAGVSIGSVYQFFPNKAAILQALNLRCLEDMRVTLDAAFTEDSFHLPVETFIERITTTLARFQEQNLTLFNVLNSPTRTAELTSTEQAFSFEISKRIERLLEHHFPALPAARRGVIALVCFRVCDSLLHLSAGADDEFRAAVNHEIKVILTAYTSTLVRAVR